MTAAMTQGDTVGRWTLLRRFSRDHRTYWECRCTCGAERAVNQGNLRLGRSLSCGCSQGVEARARQAEYGTTKDPLRGAWTTMMARCYRRNAASYENYGGRGIRVHPAWHTIEGFCAHFLKHPGGNLTLDRVNNDGDYEPGNVRWATRAEQARNKRSNRLVTVDEITLCVQDWEDSMGITRGHVRRRTRRGMTLEQAVADILANPPRRRTRAGNSHFSLP